MYVSENKSNALVYFAVARTMPNKMPLLLRLDGLDENKIYTVKGIEYSGKTLMNYGIYVDTLKTKNFILEITSHN